MHIKPLFQKIGAVITVSATLFAGYWYTQTNIEPDPLQQVLTQSNIQMKTPLSADFITDTISPYSGETSTEIEACKNNTIIKEGSGEVFAQYNQNAEI